MKMNHLAVAVGALVFGVSGAVMAQTPVLYYNFNNTEVAGSLTGSLPQATVITPENGPAGHIDTESGGTVTSGGAGAPAFPGQSFAFAGGTLITPFTGSNPISNVFTIDFWIKTTDTSAEYVLQNQGGSQSAILSNFPGDTGTNQIGLWNFGTGTPFTGADITIAYNGTWQNVAWTYDGTAASPVVTAYLNGVPVSSTAATIDLDASNTNWDIPIQPLFAGLNDSVDEFYLYNSALNANQIATLAGVSVPEPTSLSLLGLGAIGLMARRRSRKA